MNDFAELEAELKQLRPAAASRELIARVENAMREAANVPTAGVLPQRKVRVNWLGLGLGLAGATALFLILARVDVNRSTASKQPRIASSTPAAAETVAQPNLVPDGVTRVVYNTRNEGLVFPDNSEQPVRRVRSISRETVQWRDRSSGASLSVSYPTEDVRLIPVSGQ